MVLRLLGSVVATGAAASLEGAVLQIAHQRETSVRNASSASVFWCKQSNTCSGVCLQTAKQCPSHQCALHVDTDCSTWHCVDKGRADAGWLKYRTWRRATNFSCAPPLCSPVDFMGGLELGTDDARSCENAPISNVPNHLLQSQEHLEKSAETTTEFGLRVMVHGSEQIKSGMRFKLKDSLGNTFCESSLSELALQPSSSMNCDTSTQGDISVICIAPSGDGWGAESLFLEIKEHREPGLVWQMCSDFDADTQQTEVLPFLNSCDVPKLQAAVVETDAYNGDEKTHGKLGAGVWRTVFGLCSTTLAVSSFVGVKGIPGWAGTLNNVQDGTRTAVVGIDGLADDVADKQEIAHMVKDLMSSSMGKISSDVNKMSNGVKMCIQHMADNVQAEMSEVGQDVRAMMRKSDFSSQLKSSFLRSSHRASVVLKLLAELNLKHKGDSATILTASPVTSWLTSTVNAGLHDCLDIAGLVAQVSDDTMPEVLDSLGVVDKWFSFCKMFSRVAQALRPAGGEVALNARHRVEQILAREFVLYYKKAKTTSVTLMKKAQVGLAVEPFQLRAQNFLHLVAAEHYHAVNNLVFPKRQGGVAIPSTGQGWGAVSYIRKYAGGVERRWQETCRYCRKDGGQRFHYGCWEEEALSYKSCVASGGIHYNEPLEDSNVYSCRQFQSFGHFKRDIPSTLTCGGRPQQ